MGIEPTQPAWKAGALPLSYTREIPIRPIELRRSCGASATIRRPAIKSKDQALLVVLRSPLIQLRPELFGSAAVHAG